MAEDSKLTGDPVETIKEEEEQGSEIVTMMDILEEEEEMEENAFAVLGGSDDKHCTYLRVSRTFLLF